MALEIKLRQWSKSWIKFTAGIRYITLILIAKKSGKKKLPKGKIGHVKFWGEFLLLKEMVLSWEKVSRPLYIAEESSQSCCF